MSLLNVEDLSISLGDARILDGVSLSVDRGEFVGLVGPNGAGKTTLLRAINGVRPPDDGHVWIDDKERSACSTREWSRRLATVPQDTSVSFAFRVEDVVEMGRTPHRRRTQFGVSETDRRRIEDALERTETADLRDRPIDELSGGERQRVFVARALAQDTPLLVLDEPTASLDINHQVEILRLVRTLLGDGRGALAAIHDLDLAARFCDRLVLLHGGEIQAVGTPTSVLESDALEPAFETPTTVSTNPVTGTPTVTAGPGAPTADRPAEDYGGRRVHVIGGGRIGARAIATLAEAGHAVSAGVLRGGDLAVETARALDVPVVTSSTAGPIESDAIADAHELASDAAVTVLADVAIGPRQWPLDLAETSPAIVLVEDRPLADRLEGGPRASDRYERIRDRGVTTAVDELSRTVEDIEPRGEQVARD